ncbi:MAG TPA: hypothetical protein VIS49_08525 [Cyclobacteriaceae bacterium]
MENFNKNWLVILLVAVIFGTLGFLLGKTSGHGGHHPMMQFGDAKMKRIQVEVGDEGDGIVKIDTLIKDGKKIIIKEIQKTEK